MKMKTTTHDNNQGQAWDVRKPYAIHEQIHKTARTETNTNGKQNKTDKQARDVRNSHAAHVQEAEQERRGGGKKTNQRNDDETGQHNTQRENTGEASERV